MRKPAGRVPPRPLVLACLAACLASGLPACDDDAVYVKVTEEGSTQVFRATVRDGMDVTLTFSADYYNFEPSASLPLTVDLSGKKSTEFLEMVRQNADLHVDLRYRCTWRPGNRGGVHDPAAVYALPYAPNRHYLLAQGNLGAFSHGPGTGNENAFDFAMPQGSEVRAARAGVVAGVRDDSKHGGPKPDYLRCANYVMIRHDDGTYGEYLHLRFRGARVKVGDRVVVGQPIAWSGNTGYSTQPHLHFCVFRTIDGATRETIPIRFARDGRALVMREGVVY